MLPESEPIIVRPELSEEEFDAVLQQDVVPGRMTPLQKSALKAQVLTLLSKARIQATGVVAHPPLTDDDLDAIQRRADAQQDKQIKKDLFRLLIEVRRLRAEEGNEA